SRNFSENLSELFSKSLGTFQKATLLVALALLCRRLLTFATVSCR
ncbi:hypothetical protein HMPREF1869_00929, partial [Bacteroidales bacterium KA00251]